MRTKVISALSAIALTPFLLSGEMRKGQEPVLMNKGKKKDKELVCCSPFHTMHVGVRHTEAKGVGYTDGYTTLEGFGIWDYSPSFMPFLDLRGHVFNSGKVAGNIGIGERSVIPSIDHIFGLYVYYDTRQSDHGLKVNQLSPGVELLGERMEYRMNGYFPVGKHKGNRYDTEFNSFSGNQIILQSKRKYAMSGWDGEVGVHATQSTRNDVYLGVGPYYFTSNPSSSWGGKGRVYWRYKEYVSLEASYTYDHLFKSIVQGTATLSYPFGPKLKRKGKGCPNPDDLGLSRAAFAPYRFEIPVIRKKKIKDAAVNPATGDPWQVWFVNNTSSSDGTYESPFPTLVQAQNASNTNDMIYVFPGDGTTTGMNQGIVLKNVQKLFGSGIDQTIATTRGTIVIPAQSSALPNLTNTSGAGTVVQLANGNEVAGLNMQGAGIANSNLILGTEVVGGSVHDNSFSGSQNYSTAIGVLASGSFVVDNNTFTDPSAASAGIVLTVDQTNSLVARITNNTFNGYMFDMEMLVNDTASGEFIIENNNIMNCKNIALFFGGTNGQNQLALVRNNQVTNTANIAMLVLNSAITTCMEFHDNQINGTVNSSVILQPSPGTTSAFGLFGNQITNTAGTFGVIASNLAANENLCIEMIGNNVPKGYAFSNVAGSTFNVGALLNNVGPITESGTITPVGDCLCPSFEQ